MRPRSVIRDTIRFDSKTIGTRLKIPSVHIPVRCTFSCPRHLRDSFSHLSLFGVSSLAFRGPSAAHFQGLTLTCRTLRRKNGVPYVIGTTGRVIGHTFLRSEVNFLRVDSIVTAAVRGYAFLEGPICRSCLRASTRTQEVTTRLVWEGVCGRGWGVSCVSMMVVGALRLVLSLSVLIILRRNNRFLFSGLFKIEIRGFFLFFSP